MDLKDIILQTLKEYQFGNNLKNGDYITSVEKKYFIDVADDIVKKLTVMHSSTKLPVDKLQELIDETYNWQVQDLDADTLEDSLKLGIREGALVVKHYFDKK